MLSDALHSYNSEVDEETIRVLPSAPSPPITPRRSALARTAAAMAAGGGTAYAV